MKLNDKISLIHRTAGTRILTSTQAKPHLVISGMWQLFLWHCHWITWLRRQVTATLYLLNYFATGL